MTCCSEDYGGSHYHCACCVGVSSMMGHWVRVSASASFSASWMGAVPLPFDGFSCAPVMGLLRLFGHTAGLDPRAES